MEQFNASLQRGDTSCCEKATYFATPPERSQDLSRAGHSRGHALQLQKDLAVSGKGSAGIREGPRGLERHRQVHGGVRNHWSEPHRTQ